MKIEKLTKATVNKMIRLGLVEVTAWASYIKNIEMQLTEKLINFNTYRQYVIGIERLIEMSKNGKFQWKGPKVTSRFKLNQHGMDLILVLQWIGHARLETALIYAHANTEQKR